MTGQITIPFWFFLILLAFMAWVILELLLIPSARWFLRRRLNRVLDEIGSRLDIEIRPFQLTKRQVLIDRLVYDPKVIEAIQRAAQEQNLSRAMVQEEVLTYAREIVPSFNAYLYFRTGYWLAKKVARLMYWVRVGLVDNEQLAEVDPDSTVVFVMNHRSNMDYILVAFLAAERTTLSYAVGEWAKIWPLQTLIKSMGAYFVRRDSGKNPLYRLVLERYVHMATKEGVCQAVFLEGGLSRDGRLRKPKLGLMDYMLRGFDPDIDRDIVFIPVGINYDRTMEDRSLIRAQDPQAEKKSFWFVIKTTLGFVWHNLMLMVFNRWQRFGFACVNFGAPLSLRRFCRDHNFQFTKMDRDVRFPVVQTICQQIMDSIEELVPVLPISLVATVMLEDRERWLSEFDIKAHAHRLVERLQELGAPILVPTRGLEVALSTAFHMLKIRRMLEESEGRYRADPGSYNILIYYANAIARWQERSPEQGG
ncbi:MAG: 1-acyl-sn-glycerol-3-phosphate acyltransferase [Deltaproteobacteria bacterium]|nr:1-acyl-sn-glycerol-3-phosphate acyltransferase [Deltaproteobacteria bacterium]